MVSVII